MRIRKPLSLLFVGLILTLTLIFASGCTIVLPEGFEDILGDLGGGTGDTDDTDGGDGAGDDGSDDGSGDSGDAGDAGDGDDGTDGGADETCTHEWQAATCKAPATCSLCGATDGAKGAHTPEADDDDCTTAVRCTECNAVVIKANTTHMGGMPTCTSLAECSVCGKAYGELAVHAESVIWIKRLDVHYQAYACCLERVSEDEAHSSAFDCSVCGFLPTIVAEEKSASAGETVTLALSIEDNPAIIAMSVEVVFNDTALTLVGAARGTAFAPLDFTPDNRLASGAKFLFDGVDIAEGDVRDGEILILTFEISDSAAIGDYMIQISVSAYNNELKSVSFATSGGKITVEND